MSTPHDDHDLLQELSQFPLLDAIFGRRSRRFGLGMEIPDGPLAYRSTHEPVPLDPLERTLLLLCGAGITGWNTGIEYSSAGRPNTLCNYPLRHVGRSFATAASIHSSELIVMDDNGTFITQLRDVDPTGWREYQRASDIHDMGQRLWANCHQLADHRITLPREAPHMAAHNQWNANRPGATVFAPVVDLTEHMLDVLCIYLGEGYTFYDATHQQPCGNLAPFVRAGIIDGNRRMPLAGFEQHMLASGAMEVMQMCHNMVLLMQAIGLGGWMFTGMNSLSLMGAFASDGIPGFGFEFVRDDRWMLPNPVGIPGCFEIMGPPFHVDMSAAVVAFVDRKFGPGGTFDPDRPGPYRDNAAVKNAVDRPTPEFVELVCEVASYIHDTYGRFPGTMPSIYMRPYVQAHHLDLDFYDRFYGDSAYLDTHRDHMNEWHGR